jgi:hypothetical protein
MRGSTIQLQGTGGSVRGHHGAAILPPPGVVGKRGGGKIAAHVASLTFGFIASWEAR